MTMADKLSGFRILILEAREEAQFARLLAEQGAEVLQCPMFTIRDAPDLARLRHERPAPRRWMDGVQEWAPHRDGGRALVGRRGLAWIT